MDTVMSEELAAWTLCAVRRRPAKVMPRRSVAEKMIAKVRIDFDAPKLDDEYAPPKRF